MNISLWRIYFFTEIISWLKKRDPHPAEEEAKE